MKLFVGEDAAGRFDTGNGPLQAACQ